MNKILQIMIVTWKGFVHFKMIWVEQLTPQNHKISQKLPTNYLALTLPKKLF